MGGVIEFMQNPRAGKTAYRGEVWGISPGKHGFHIHTLGDGTDGCASMGGHFNPDNSPIHGAHHDHSSERRAGDLEQLVADKSGRAKVANVDGNFDLWGTHSIIGRSLMVHAKEDDLGRGGNAGSYSTGNAGRRVGCCTIGLAAPPQPKQW